MCKKLIYLLSLVFVLSMVLASPANAADPNLQLWLEFEGDANDSSGNDRHGTLMGNPGFDAGIFGQALDTTISGGDPEYVEITGYDGILGPNAFSIAAWLKTTDGTGHIVSWGTASNGQRVQFQINSTRLRFVCGGGNVQGDTKVNDNEWHHVAMTAKANATPDSDFIRHYFDGIDDTRNKNDGTPSISLVKGFPVTIARQYDNPTGGWLDALIDDVRIYDKELSAAEIYALSLRLEPILDSPADEDILAVTGTLLKWAPGAYAADVNGHEVYLSDIFEDVNAGAGDPCVLDGSDTQISVTGLDIGKVYYWKVDAVNESHPDVRWSSEIWSFMVPPLEAWDPFPPDEQKFVDPNVLLEWQPGLGGIASAVYWGTNFADVNSDTGATEQSDPNYYPGPLAYDANYYWRIDTNDGDSTVKGLVWSFRTYPATAITDANLVGYWKLDLADGNFPNVVVDSSGYDHYGQLYNGAQYVAGFMDEAVQLDGVDDYVSMDNYKGILGTNAFSVAAWINTTSTHGSAGADQDAIIGWGSTAGGTQFNFRMSNEGTQEVPFSVRTAQGNANVQGYTPVNDGEWHHVAATLASGGIASSSYIRIYVDGKDDTRESTDPDIRNIVADADVSIGVRAAQGDRNFEGLIDEVRIYDYALTDAEVRAISGVDLEKAWKPRPADGATDVPIKPILMWEPGDYAPGTNGHNVYFGADDPGNMVLVSTPAQPQTPNEYDPGALDLGRTYYWAVDEVNNGGADAGDTWSFTVIESLVVDDMESYGDSNTPGPGGAIFFVWRDGWTLLEDDGFPPGFLSNNTGASIGYWTPPYAEGTIVNGGVQSMPYFYDNDGEVTDNPDNPLEHYSKAEAEISDLPSGIDPNWLAVGAKALTLSFHGDVNNDVEPMWVELTDTASGKAKVKYGPPYLGEDVNDVNEESWHEWNIDLQDFADGGVDLTDVNSIAIIIGEVADDPNGSGTVYIDDIRLYAARCVLDKRDADFTRFDYAPTGPGGDCVTDARELDVMFGDWLDYDYTVYATPPSGANLAAHWEFEGDFNDSSINGHDGDPCGGATIVYDATRDSNVLSLDGVDGYVNITGYSGILGGASRTVCMWINTADAGGDAPNGRALIGWGTNATGQRWGLAVNKQDAGGRIVDALRINVNGGTRTGTTVLTDSTWHHVAAVQLDDGSPNANELQLYVDGVEETYSQSQGRAINTTANIDVRIGLGVKTSDLPNYGGLIDDVRIYDYALSAAEVMSAAGVAEVYYELTSVANVYDEEAKNSKVVNFKDYALLVDEWLEKDLFPPEGAD